MNRRIVSILVALLVLAVFLSLGQSETFAQGTGPGNGADQAGPPAPDPDGGDQVGPAVTDPGGGDQAEPPLVSADGAGESEPSVVDAIGPDALVTSAFTYQGQLRSAGVPVNATCDFIWDIYAASAGGASLATDTDTLAVQHGLFTAVINVPATLIDGNARFLGIQVRCPAGVGAYTLLTPRQELFAAPYALGLRLPFAHTIDNSGSPIFAVTNSSTATSSPSFLGQSAGGDGVKGISSGAGNADNGVYGETNSTDSTEAGVKGVSTSSATGGYFTSSTGNGVRGSTSSATYYGGYFSNPSATSGAALYANGDAKQSLTGDGFVKAAVYLTCSNAGSNVTRYFNNVNTTAITVIDGGSAGQCTIDFGFNVEDRYVSALPYGIGVARMITFAPGSTANRLNFYRWDQNGAGTNGVMTVLIY